MPSADQSLPAEAARHELQHHTRHRRGCRQSRSFAPRDELPLGRHLAKRLAHYFGDATSNTRRDSFSQVIADRARALCEFLALYQQEPQPLARLAQTGRIVQQVEHLHRLLDSALVNAGAGDAAASREPVLLARWRYFWLRERQQRVRFFDKMLQRPNGLHCDYDISRHPLVPATEAEQLEVLTLLRDDVGRHGCRGRQDSNSTTVTTTSSTSLLLPMEQELTERAFALVTRTTNLMVTRVPAWFTSRFDLAAQRSRWQQAPDLVVHHLSDPLTAVTEERCAALANNWARLAHPLVAAMRGACHVGATPFVVYERGPTLTGSLLRDRQQLERGAHCSSIRWRALYEAALALRFLHSRGVAHESLSCADILISSSLTTATPRRTRVRVKMAGYNLREACDSGKIGEVKRPCRAGRDSPWRIWRVWQWLAPERIMGTGPSAAADVFSLGMCVLEAARLGAPWEGDRDDEFPYQVGHRLVLAGLLPPRPQSCRLSDRQWALVQKMCAFDPRDRAELGAVISELRCFAKMEEEQEEEDMVKEKELGCGAKRKQCALDAGDHDAPANPSSRIGEAVASVPITTTAAPSVVARASSAAVVAAKRMRSARGD